MPTHKAKSKTFLLTYKQSKTLLIQNTSIVDIDNEGYEKHCFLVPHIHEMIANKVRYTEMAQLNK